MIKTVARQAVKLWHFTADYRSDTDNYILIAETFEHAKIALMNHFLANYSKQNAQSLFKQCLKGHNGEPEDGVINICQSFD